MKQIKPKTIPRDRIAHRHTLIIDKDYYRNEYGIENTRPSDIGKTLNELRKELSKESFNNY
jgi:hypothetical protein